MKEFSYTINLGLVGTEDSQKRIFLDYLKQIALKFASEDLIWKFFLLFEGIPINLKAILAESFEDLISRRITFKRFDAIIIAANIYNDKSINNINIENYTKFSQRFMFNGISVLAGIDPFLILKKKPLNERRINEFSLIQKTRELELLYCFKIQNLQRDVKDVFDKILNDIHFKLEFLNPELFERAKAYGKILSK
ncbi:hypothetical protein ES705_07135 [subsurface metagenome]